MATKDYSVLVNDLIAINKNRIGYYEKAIAVIKGAELVLLFKDRLEEGKDCIRQLADFLEPVDEGGKNNSGAGLIFALWKEETVAFKWESRQSILYSCNSCDEAVLKAYLESINVLQNNAYPVELFELVSQQLEQIRLDLTEIRTYFTLGSSL